ncbi:hypothetical protein NLM33_33385 [Bradyrhizobium sp. CCGUVB1N3]|uniref:hypothetical protein n=1 Tax=Bradyrhizobium sp. CCGUVB1N3 TaxID=2949629 RepID=UPI0020B375A8|nr:hypothetical protein [Bradyrhizobium sp. CCGUVB1N3]MCP3475219.1 hypothetical protein [Bradyrhizobium sp. CCGUVB1N3]
MVNLPSEGEVDAATAALEPYFTALGRVAHSWNHLHEELGKLFCSVTGLELHHGMAIWHKLKSDRSQRDILKGAIDARAQETDWVAKRPSVTAAINDLLHETNSLADRRNNAVHAPCSIALHGNRKDFEIVPVTFFGNDKAKRLIGKDIIEEFKWYEWCADTLKRYTTSCRLAVDAELLSIEKPQMPTRGQTRN